MNTDNMVEIPNNSFWGVFKTTPGAVSVTESIAIFNIAKLAPKGTCIELGSHKGKSGMSAVLGLKRGSELYLVDPIFEDEKLANSVATEVYDVDSGKVGVKTIAGYSTDVIGKHAPYAYVFWDSGEHAGEVLWKERDMLEDALIPGGILCSHDIGNQFTQQKEAMDSLVATGKYEWIPIDWPAIIKYVKEHNLEEGNNSWHIYEENPTPNFVGAVRRK